MQKKEITVRNTVSKRAEDIRKKAASSGNYRRGRRGKCREKCGGVFHAAVMTPYKKRLHANLLN